MYHRALAYIGAVVLVGGGSAWANVEMRAESIVRTRPDVKAPKRGAVARGARFAVIERAEGRGCRHGWLRIGQAAWVCGDSAAATDAGPGGAELPRVADGELLPSTYVVATDATAYQSVDAATAGDEGTPLAGKSGLRLRGRAEKDGRTFYHTSKGWVAADTVKLASPSPYHGLALDDKTVWPFALVADDARGRLFDAAGHEVEPAGRFPRGQVVAPVPAAVTLRGGVRAYPVGDDLFLAAKIVRRVERAPRPDEIAADEHWLDVSVDEQVLVAYEGDRPVYATLVSTALNTPKGVHRVQEKLPHPLLESDAKYRSASSYRYETPWVMSLGGRYAVHAVYWHGAFGRNHGEGCVNVSPRDARWLWSFAGPELPPGWTYVRSAEDDGVKGTAVRIR